MSYTVKRVLRSEFADESGLGAKLTTYLNAQNDELVSLDVGDNMVTLVFKAKPEQKPEPKPEQTHDTRPDERHSHKR